jgi:hypothetical protein
MSIVNDCTTFLTVILAHDGNNSILLRIYRVNVSRGHPFCAQDKKGQNQILAFRRDKKNVTLK